eukprot:TRINITY_DN3471_c0_g1_i1.p1 TRINITY_DN3471_c0_g1~~TRINITY_DN3471_c0_g1_i1.p1  ORF type:complete len:400 (+),score=88.53 TRINITY_DN3471_c0_g1_i1:44-1243(+)
MAKDVRFDKPTKILDKRAPKLTTDAKDYEYLVQWAHGQDAWESDSDLDVFFPGLVQQYADPSYVREQRMRHFESDTTTTSKYFHSASSIPISPSSESPPPPPPPPPPRAHSQPSHHNNHKPGVLVAAAAHLMKATASSPATSAATSAAAAAHLSNMLQPPAPLSTPLRSHAKFAPTTRSSVLVSPAQTTVSTPAPSTAAAASEIEPSASPSPPKRKRALHSSGSDSGEDVMIVEQVNNPSAAAAVPAQQAVVGPAQRQLMALRSTPMIPQRQQQQQQEQQQPEPPRKRFQGSPHPQTLQPPPPPPTKRAKVISMRTVRDLHRPPHLELCLRFTDNTPEQWLPVEHAREVMRDQPTDFYEPFVLTAQQMAKNEQFPSHLDVPDESDDCREQPVDTYGLSL